MAKVGYIFKADRYDGFEADKEWMQKYGCVQVIEELVENEALRPRWKQLVANLERGDEIVVAKFSNALRGSRELSAFIELCRIKVVRIISIHDRTKPDTDRCQNQEKRCDDNHQHRLSHRGKQTIFHSLSFSSL